MDNKDIVISHEQLDHVERDIHPEMLKVGQWYWVKMDTEGKLKPDEWLGCITKIGSNFVLIEQPRYDYQGKAWDTDTELHCYSRRIHFKHVMDNLRRPENDQEAINSVTNDYGKKANQYMAEIHEISKRIGVRQDNMLQEDHTGSSGTGVAVFSGNVDIHAYKNELIKAKEVDLPKLFNELKNAHVGLAQWMAAPALTIQNTMNEMKEDLDKINDRIFNVSLYAGIEETIVTCKEGNPADISDKLHIMQRKLYMDEECLLNYEAGGMEFDDIADFDNWLSREENFHRILPFPKTVVAMQVRRKKKQRETDTLHQYIDVLRRQEADKFTYLYVRNGEQLHRVIFEKIDFDENLFPDRAEFDPSEELRINRSGSNVKGVVTNAYFQQLQKELVEVEKTQEEQEAAEIAKLGNIEDEEKLKREIDRIRFFNRARSKAGDIRRELQDYEDLFNSDSVYFDDTVEYLGKAFKKYNRISLIIQGIFDRSSMLAPHLPVKTWVQESFNQSIKLVYDNENALYEGEKPDFEAYRDQCNSLATKDSFFVGQRDYWMRKNAEKENEASRYMRNPTNFIRFVPYDNPGMLNVCQADNVSKRGATFKWQKERSNKRWRGDNAPVQCTITVPMSEIFNVSAYKKGDYKKFFADPRTRQEYVKWAPLLLAAEDFLANRHTDDEGESRVRCANQYGY